MIEALDKLKEAGFTVLEVRLMGLSKARRKDGDWFELKIQVMPEEMPHNLYTVPLGTRMGVAMVEIADDETPKKRDFKDLSPAEQAGIRCNDPSFYSWICNQPWARDRKWSVDDTMETISAHLVREACRVSSRSDLNHKAMPREVWQELNAQFEADTRLPERRG